METESCSLAFVMSLANRKAGQLAGRYGFSKDDREDLKQDFIWDYLRRCRHHDPNRSPCRAFVIHVLQNRVATLIASQKAQSRDYRRWGGSLDTSVENSWSALRLNLTDETPPGIQDLRIDLSRVVAALPAALAEVTKLLASHTPTEAATALSVPRLRVYRRIAELRTIFRRAGLEEYLPRHSSRARTQGGIT
jgi:hypothetical protein